MHHDLTLKETKKQWHGSLKAYAIGFIACLILTSASFLLTIYKPFEGFTLPIGLVALALLQAVVQLLLFLHVGQEAKPRWETMVFLFMLLVLCIIAGGTLWIMYNLNWRVMSM